MPKLKIEQIYTGCLAQGAYYITCQGEAAIIDPLRETDPYTTRIEKDKVTLKYVFETHFHADFVSGHLDLSKKTGAPIVYGTNANPAFDAIIAADGQTFTLGNATIKAIHTPGHTLESTCYLLLDEKNEPVALFSGDTLFLGDVGRPDLAQKAANLTQEQLAELLYDSLYTKILPLPDHITVYPAHGAGSACGKNMMKETLDSLGNQKKINYALNQPNKAAFVNAVLEGLTPPPAYFGSNVNMNKNGYKNFETVVKKAFTPLNPQEFEAIAEAANALILDTRAAAEFAQGFVPQSINIGIVGDFAPWVGSLIANVNQNILLVTDPSTEQETITRLARVGFDNVLGYLNGGFQAWKNTGKDIDTINRITPQNFEKQCTETLNPLIIDVRKPSEFNAEHLTKANNNPLDNINEWINTILSSQQHFFIHCAGGYRSMIAASILQARGYRNFSEVAGGFNAIKTDTSLPTTDFVCPSKK